MSPSPAPGPDAGAVEPTPQHGLEEARGAIEAVKKRRAPADPPADPPPDPLAPTPQYGLEEAKAAIERVKRGRK